MYYTSKAVCKKYKEKNCDFVNVSNAVDFFPTSFYNSVEVNHLDIL